MPSKRSRTPKITQEMSRAGKSIELESRLVVAEDWEQGGWGATAHGCTVSFRGDTLKLDNVDDCITL